MEELPEEEQARFQQLYCGLCQMLKQRYGLPGQMILNYDFAFLSALLLAGEETEEHRCIVHPVKKRTVLQSDDALALAADASVILTYWQLKDKVQDETFIKSTGARAAALALERAYHKAALLQPDFDGCVSRQLQLLQQLEKENCASIDRVADCFALLLQSIAQQIPEGSRRRVLEQILYHLGRWIYLIDAVDDLQKDAAGGQYNPILLRYGESRLSPDNRTELMLTLQHSINLMASAYALEDFGHWSMILENIFYRSLAAVSRAVFDGTFRAAKRPRFSQKQGEDKPSA